MPIDLAEYDDVVHRIYDAALEPSNWTGVIAHIARVFDAPRALIFTHLHGPAQGGFTFTHNITQAALEIWAAKGVKEDPWVRASGPKGYLVEGMVSLDSDLVPEAELMRTDFYKEILEPLGIAKVCSGIIFDTTDSHKLPTALSVYRGPRDTPFDRDDVEVSRRLLAHLSRSLGVMFHLRDSQLQLAASLAALNGLASGVILIDGSRKVQFANKTAESIARRGDTVCIGAAGSAKPSQLSLNRRLSGCERAFQDAISQAMQPLALTTVDHFSQALLLPAEDGSPACVVHVAPLAESSRFAPAGKAAKAIVFLYDLQSAASVDPALLIKLFGLTMAEARTALQMTQGGSLDEMAARLGVSINTCKTQLQAAYAKTGTHRQADLLKLLLGLASR